MWRLLKEKETRVPKTLPPTAVLEMTYRCNHACLFCSCPWYGNAFKRGNELSTREWCDLISEYAANGVQSFSFTGGESLLRDDLVEIIEYTSRQICYRFDFENDVVVKRMAPASMSLLSNGKRMNHDILSLCKRYDILLMMSLPGLTTFSEHTRGGMSADHVLKWFSEAKALGLSTTAGITVTSRNLFELRDTIIYAAKAGAEAILLNRFMPGGRGLKHRNLELSFEQMLLMPDIADKALAEIGIRGHIGTEMPLCIIRPEGYTHLDVGTLCSAVNQFFVTGPNGMIRVCNHSPYELVPWQNWQSLENHPYWRKFYLRDYIPGECHGCDCACSCCDGGCREAANVVYGTPNAKDPLFGTSFPLHKSHPKTPWQEKA